MNVDVCQWIAMGTVLYACCVDRVDNICRQKAAVDAVEASAGLVFYDYELVAPGIVRRARPPAPAWAVNLVGVDFFATPLEASLGNGGIRQVGDLTQLRRLNVSCPVKDADLVHLKTLRELQYLDLGACPIGDAGLPHLEELTRLEYLGVWSTNVSDAGLQHLKCLTQLQRMNLSDTKITDAGLEHLSGLKQLQWLDVEQTFVTRAGVAKLRRMLPKCRIHE